MNSMHRQIIDEHHKQMLKERWEEKMEYDNWGCFRRLKYKVKMWFKLQDDYHNKHLIDYYIDNYWLIHCPDSLSVRELNS